MGAQKHTKYIVDKQKKKTAIKHLKYLSIGESLFTLSVCIMNECSYDSRRKFSFIYV
jgi:hypothetical protein